MKKEILERILKVTIILTVLLIIIFNLLGINIFTKAGIVKIPSIISIIVVFWMFYISIGWKWPLLKHIVYKENINGTWLGTYFSKDFTTDNKYNGEIVIVIRQTFLRIDVKSHTERFINYSFSESFSYDEKSDTNQLIYLYTQNQFDPTDDNYRKGTSELILHLNVNQKELTGDF
ncbi:hypothetical protein QNH98_03190 [Myroides sp. mNGS23_01]|nr:hypothetical protein [Myroides sp. mNGS23_01]WHT39702.1 hypothetical protein QNH98_03190 [Myroides sp. mNGS23_01]